MESETANELNQDARQAKAALRERIRAELKKLTAAECADASVRACDLLRKQAVWAQAGAILFYAPLADEPDLWPLLTEALAAGKTVALPRFEGEQNHYAAALIRDPMRDIRPGRFGVREPVADCPGVELNRLDLMLVPGVAFDLDGGRVGRGRGYYDRLLSEFAGVACGVAFDEQIVARVPREPHDARLNCLLTPTRWRLVTGRARF
jgi:5-formyltetrahydrofolate cyclo-ligase